MKLIVFITLFCNFTVNAAVNTVEFSLLKDAVSRAFSDIAPQNDTLTINKPIQGIPDQNYWWNLDQIHASYVLEERTEDHAFHNIYIFGGLGRMEAMSVDGLAITMCHEIGHGIGGEPYKHSGSSQEGQSDYFATKTCLKEVFKYLPISEDLDTSAYQDFCHKAQDYEYCLRAMVALESDIAFYAYLGDQVSIQKYATEVATELNSENTFYPSSQCRLDTSILGILGKERPNCWYPGGTSRH